MKVRTFLLFQWSRWDYEYLRRELGEECRVVFSRDYPQRVLRYLSGAVEVLRLSGRGDTIVCWYDAQAVMCWWMARLSGMKRNIVCIRELSDNIHDNFFCSNFFCKFLCNIFCSDHIRKLHRKSRRHFLQHSACFLNYGRGT